MPCDRALGAIEKVIRNHGYICSIPKYIELMEGTCKKKKKKKISTKCMKCNSSISMM